MFTFILLLIYFVSPQPKFKLIAEGSCKTLVLLVLFEMFIATLTGCWSVVYRRCLPFCIASSWRTFLPWPSCLLSWPRSGWWPKPASQDASSGIWRCSRTRIEPVPLPLSSQPKQWICELAKPWVFQKSTGFFRNSFSFLLIWAQWASFYAKRTNFFTFQKKILCPFLPRVITVLSKYLLAEIAICSQRIIQIFCQKVI